MAYFITEEKMNALLISICKGTHSCNTILHNFFTLCVRVHVHVYGYINELQTCLYMFMHG